MIELKHRKIIGISVLGTMLEFYDFTLYAIFITTLSQHFFPETSHIASLLAAFGAFAAGFIMRPLGGIFFGYIGDKYGRRNALSLSILLMGIPCLIMGILPSYDTAGIISTMLLFLCRMIQGLSSGGEFTGAAIFALEHVEKKFPGLAGSLVSVAGGFGSLFAIVASYIVTLSGGTETWRIPFVVGGFISLIGVFLRRQLEETPVFSELQKKTLQKSPTEYFKMLSQYKLSFLITILIGAIDGTLLYMLIGFLRVYMEIFLEIETSKSSLIGALGLIFYLIVTPLMGMLYDRLGESHKFIPTMAVLFILGSFVSFALLKSGLLILGIFIFALMCAGISASEHPYIQKLFPPAIRYIGVSFGFNLGTAVLGGTAPMLLLSFIHSSQSLWIPSFYISVLSLMLLGTTRLQKRL
jgi:MFS transporter, MHS family, proline/betaine transporter